MIIYKRELNIDDLENLADDEELICYKSDDVAILITIVDGHYLARKKHISDNKLIEEALFNMIEDAIIFSY